MMSSQTLTGGMRLMTVGSFDLGAETERLSLDLVESVRYCIDSAASRYCFYNMAISSSLRICFERPVA